MYESIGKILVWVLAIPLVVILHGYTLSWIWTWFVVPIWGCNPLTVKQSIGLTFVVGVLTSHLSQKNRDQDEDDVWGRLVGILLTPIFILIFGWILHQFI